MELMDSQRQKVSQRISPFNSDQNELLEGTECRAGLGERSVDLRRGRRGRPSPLLSPNPPSPRSRKVTGDHGLSVWVPGAHRSPQEPNK